MMTRKLQCVALTMAASLCALPAAPRGVQAADDAAPKAVPVVSELDNPSGLAVQPGTGHVFIAARPGVYRLVPGKDNKVNLEVSGYATDIYGKGPKYNIGPLGVSFLGAEHIVVGDGSLPDAQELVRVYKVGTAPAAKPAGADTATQTLGPITAGDDSAKGEGNFYGVAINDRAIYVTSNGDDTKGWVLKSDIVNGKPGELKPFIATKPEVNVDAPVGITFSANGKELVVSQMGEMNVPGDSLLTTYDPATGKLLKSYKTGLHDIAGVAISPKSGKLYAVDFAWVDTANGGLFRLDVSGNEVKAEKILGLDKPTSLTFDKEGNLYVTVFGTAAEGATKPAGAVLKIKGDL